MNRTQNRKCNTAIGTSINWTEVCDRVHNHWNCYERAQNPEQVFGARLHAQVGYFRCKLCAEFKLYYVVSVWKKFSGLESSWAIKNWTSSVFSIFVPFSCSFVYFGVLFYILLIDTQPDDSIRDMINQTKSCSPCPTVVKRLF